MVVKSEGLGRYPRVTRRITAHLPIFCPHGLLQDLPLKPQTLVSPSHSRVTSIAVEASVHADRPCSSKRQLASRRLPPMKSHQHPVGVSVKASVYKVPGDSLGVSDYHYSLSHCTTTFNALFPPPSVSGAHSSVTPTRAAPSAPREQCRASCVSCRAASALRARLPRWFVGRGWG